ncbi:MAG: arylsulfotransferase family protein, partial [Solirubrobacteraceae bacterium]
MVPAAVRVTKLPHEAAPGDLFVAPQTGPVQYGPELLGPYGGLIWFKTVPKGESATDFRVQTYEGKRVLTWWQGTVNGGIGTGQDEIYSSSYQPVATVRAGNGLRGDLHEFELTSANTALITAYYPVWWNTSGIKNGSKHDLVLDSVAQEIDVKTGLVLWEWNSLDHVPVTDSYQFAPPEAGHPWDYFHINSIQQAPDRSILISSRNAWAAYDVSQQTGAVNWTLGGKDSSFKMGPRTQFAFQHDVR